LVLNPQTGEETPFGDGRNHGGVPMVRTSKGTFISGSGVRSTDGGKTWLPSPGMPDLHSDGWRFQMVALKNGIIFASQIAGPGFGGEKVQFVVSADDGLSWKTDRPVDFYDPGRAIGGRSCARSVELKDNTLATLFYDTDANQPGGSGVFFRSMNTRLLSRL